MTKVINSCMALIKHADIIDVAGFGNVQRASPNPVERRVGTMSLSCSQARGKMHANPSITLLAGLRQRPLF